MIQKPVWLNSLTDPNKKYDFRQISRNTTCESDIIYDEDIYHLAIGLLKGISFNKGILLLGVTVSNLSQGSLSLNYEDDEKKRNRNNAVDALKAKFGFDIITRGSIKSS